MSFQTLNHVVSINKDKLLDLFLGQGNLFIVLNEQMPITIIDFSDRRLLREVDGASIHQAKIYGQSKDPKVSYVDGTVTITPTQDNEVFECRFKLYLENYSE